MTGNRPAISPAGTVSTSASPAPESTLTNAEVFISDKFPALQRNDREPPLRAERRRRTCLRLRLPPTGRRSTVYVYTQLDPSPPPEGASSSTAINIKTPSTHQRRESRPSGREAAARMTSPPTTELQPQLERPAAAAPASESDVTRRYNAPLTTLRRPAPVRRSHPGRGVAHLDGKEPRY